jgi:hypothetical protein
MTLPTSVLTKDQSFKSPVKQIADNLRMYVTIRYDDKCNNNHNTFSITATITRNARFYAGGCLHEDIATYFPEYIPLLKWHGTTSDGPLHYIANTLYHLGYCEIEPIPNFEYAKTSAVYPNMPESFLTMGKELVTNELESRLPNLMQEFKQTMESLNFVY